MAAPFVEKTKPNNGNGKVKDWWDTNPISQKMTTMLLRIGEVIQGKIPLLIVSGPPGIAKTTSALYQLDLLFEAEYEAWLNKAPRKPRRTLKADDGREVFNEPYRIITGEITFPVFFCRMFWCSQKGEVLLIDDVASIADRRIRSVVHQAADPSHNGTVRYGFKTAPPDELVPRKYSFQGGIIIITNLRNDDPTEADQLRKLLGPALIDRAEFVEFPWDAPALYEYVTNLAFGTDPEAGLYKYLLAETREQNPLLERDKEGLGFKGSSPQNRHKEACAMMLDVAKLFKQHYEQNRVPHDAISFRTLRKWLRDRVNHPTAQRGPDGKMQKDWKGLIEENLLPLPKESSKDQIKNTRTSAYEERPDKSRG